MVQSLKENFFSVCCAFSQDFKISSSTNLFLLFLLVVMKGRNYKVIWYVLFHSDEVSNITQSTNSQSAGYPAGKLGADLSGKGWLVNLCTAFLLEDTFLFSVRGWGNGVIQGKLLTGFVTCSSFFQ